MASKRTNVVIPADLQVLIDQYEAVTKGDKNAVKVSEFARKGIIQGISKHLGIKTDYELAKLKRGGLNNPAGANGRGLS